MSGKKAYTLTEIIVVLALVLGAVTLWVWTLSISRNQSGELNKDQQYHNLSAGLINTIRRDLRSAVHFKKIKNNIWELESLILDEKGLPESRKIVYEFDEKHQKIHVKQEGRTKTYDFSQVTDGRKISFEFVD